MKTQTTMTETEATQWVRAKESIRLTDWDVQATYGITYPDGDGTGACDVSVSVAECDGRWYLRTSDDAGGSDDCDATPYDTEDDARQAADDLATECDECDGMGAEKWLAKQEEDMIEIGKSDGGEWVLAHNDGSRWDDDRYSDRAAAEAAISKWYDDTQAGNPGTSIIWHLMDCPELASIDEDDEVTLVSDEEIND